MFIFLFLLAGQSIGSGSDRKSSDSQYLLDRNDLFQEYYPEANSPEVYHSRSRKTPETELDFSTEGLTITRVRTRNPRSTSPIPYPVNVIIGPATIKKMQDYTVERITIVDQLRAVVQII